MNVPTLRALLVDDEMLARLAIRQAIASHPDVEVVGECANAAEARQAIAALAPDLLFLDVRMPGIDGFELLHGVDVAPPLVVFATADANHALRAFDVDAIDYVLKPIDQARFDQAMARVRRHRHDPDATKAAAPATYLRRLSVACGERVRVIATDDIDWIRAEGNYVAIHAAGATYLHREPLGGLYASLDPARFLRIHRGIVVNMDRIAEIHPLFRDHAKVVLHDGTQLSLSRRFRADARRALGHA